MSTVGLTGSRREMEVLCCDRYIDNELKRVYFECGSCGQVYRMVVKRCRMELMDKYRCVVCGKVEYKPSVGQSSRTFMGRCKEHHEASSDVSASQSASVPKGRSASS